jgi:putative DNA methylase
VSDNDRRLIEEYLPVAEVSYESTREKVLRRRNGHISMLHLWWARRPLAAARAAIYATLVPDSAAGDDRAEQRQRFRDLCRWVGPQTDPMTADRFRKALAQVRKEIRAAHGNERPKVLDCFAGGGAIPLEALRLGCETYALELNPVAHLIELCCLVYPQEYGVGLASEVAKWGRWVIERAYEELKDLYPMIPDPAAGNGRTAQSPASVPQQPRLRTPDGELLDIGAEPDEEDDENGRPLVDVPPGHLLPVAYLWTRTVRCPNPTCGADVPILRQTWLVKKDKRKVAVRATPDRTNRRMRYEVVEVRGNSKLDFNPGAGNERGNVTCPFCGGPVSVSYTRDQGIMGVMGQRAMAVVAVKPGGRGKVYLPSTVLDGGGEDDIALRERARQCAQDAGVSLPTELLQSQDTQNIRVPLYGLLHFLDLFTPRQLVALLTFVKWIRAAHAEMLTQNLPQDRAKAIATYLGMVLDRVVNRSSSLAFWNPMNEKTEQTYARQALPMVWDFSEVNPFGGTSGDIGAALREVCQVIVECTKSIEGLPELLAVERGAHVSRGSATQIPLPSSSLDAVVTDPPYYDNISYANLSDFFYVWLKRSVGFLYPEHFGTELTPKRNEAVVAAYRHDKSKAEARRFYEDMMLKSLEECNRVLKAGAPLVVVYAHKTTAGWTTLVNALRHARFVVTEAWPLDTEKPNRVSQVGTASLASSIFLVARRREGDLSGDYATQVAPQLRAIIAERVKTLMAAGISGADLVIATIGAGLRAYTQYARVELPNGEELDATMYLDEVQREALEVILAEVLHCDRRGVGAVDKPTRFYVLGRYEYSEHMVEFDEVNVLAHGVGIELKGLGGLMEGRHALAVKTKEGVLMRDYTERGSEPTLGQPVVGAATAPLIDVLHRLLWLVEHEPSHIPMLLKTTQPDIERLRLVAEALRGRALAIEPTPGAASDQRTPEQAAIERLLASWKRVTEMARQPILLAEEDTSR